MSLKNVKRVTFSLPKITVKKLELTIPKNKRSKFVAECIEKNLPGEGNLTLEEIGRRWDELADMAPNKTKKSAVELVREDRQSH